MNSIHEAHDDIGVINLPAPERLFVPRSAWSAFHSGSTIV